MIPSAITMLWSSAAAEPVPSIIRMCLSTTTGAFTTTNSSEPVGTEMAGGSCCANGQSTSNRIQIVTLMSFDIRLLDVRPCYCGSTSAAAQIGTDGSRTSNDVVTLAEGRRVAATLQYFSAAN